MNVYLLVMGLLAMWSGYAPVDFHYLQTLPLSSRCSLGALSSRMASFSSVTFSPLCQLWALSLMSLRAKVNCHGLCAMLFNSRAALVINSWWTVDHLSSDIEINMNCCYSVQSLSSTKSCKTRSDMSIHIPCRTAHRQRHSVNGAGQGPEAAG